MDIKSRKAVVGNPAKTKPFNRRACLAHGHWACRAGVELDLDHADVDLPHDTHRLARGYNVERVFPWTAIGLFYIDWQLKVDDPRSCAHRLKI